jgi:hypothetical protein
MAPHSVEEFREDSSFLAIFLRQKQHASGPVGCADGNVGYPLLP